MLIIDSKKSSFRFKHKLSKPSKINTNHYCQKCLCMNIKILQNKCKRHKLLKAGAIILDKEKQNILLIKGKHANKWNVPKGSSDDNESIRNTAIREICEETGITTTISKYDIPIKIYKVFLYTIIINKNIKIDPQDKEEIQEAKWFRLCDLHSIKNKTTLLKKVINYLNTHMNLDLDLSD